MSGAIADTGTGTGTGTIVVKIGGEVVGSGEAAVLAADLRELVAGRRARAIVHGGGPQATELQKRLGIETKQVAGRRVADAATLDVMKMAIAGKLNVDLCAILGAAGLQPVGLHGASALAVQAVRRPPKVYPSAGPEPVDMGFVGDVTGFNLALLETLWGAGFVPVIACLGADASGGVFNINARIWWGISWRRRSRRGGCSSVTSTPRRAAGRERPGVEAGASTLARGAAGDRRRRGDGRHDRQARGGDGGGRPGRGRDPHPRQARPQAICVRAVREPGAVGTTLVAWTRRGTRRAGRPSRGVSRRAARR